jgi:pyruvate formate lyase activating enzyme
MHSLKENTSFKEALLYEKLQDKKVRCNICQRSCVIKNNDRGYCLTRLNKDGILYTLIYSKVASYAVSPIEKKPLYHFYPGSEWLSLGTLGCNFRCPGCQNWEIAHDEIELNQKKTETITPEQSIVLAKNYDCKGISWTYNEPTVWFEYTLDGARLAKENHLLTNYVTNGFITLEALDTIAPYLDAFRVDIKGFSKKFYKRMCHISDFKGILQITERAKRKHGMWVEIVTNLTPGYNDDEAQLKGIASWIKNDLGQDTPWHITRFIPHLELSNVPATPVSTLEKAREIGLNQGLLYVYLGNVFGHPAENTYCHRCKRLLVHRKGLYIIDNKIEGEKCSFCGTKIPGRFE